jgi:catechol-2,3-dioxygenase
MGQGFSLDISHFGLYVTDVDRMVDFYSRMFGFVVSDRGESSAGPAIVFMTRDPREHHQLVFAAGRPADLPFNIVNQMSFRVDSLKSLRDMQTKLKQEPGVTILGPVSHGNALSLYFRDPEGNRVELLIDTPWHVPQPCRIPVDLSLPDGELWRYIEEKARALPGFRLRSEWQAEITQKIARAAPTAH